MFSEARLIVVCKLEVRWQFLSSKSTVTFGRDRIDMTTVKLDMDYCNFLAKTSIVSTVPIWQICSDNENSGPLVRNTTTWTRHGFNDYVWLASNSIYLMIRRDEHARLAAALGRVAVHALPSLGYESAPVRDVPNFALQSMKVSSSKLSKALEVCNINTVRVVSLNLKMDLNDFIVMVRDHGTRGKYSVDIATVIRKFVPGVDDDDVKVELDDDEQVDGVPLICFKRSFGHGRVWNLLAQAGCAEAAALYEARDAHTQYAPCGTFVTSKKLNGSDGKSHCRKIVIYPGGLVVEVSPPKTPYFRLYLTKISELLAFLPMPKINQLFLKFT